MVSISAPQPICHKAMAGEIVIFTRAAVAIAAITKSNSATAELQCTNTLNILTPKISFFVDLSIISRVLSFTKSFKTHSSLFGQTRKANGV